MKILVFIFLSLSIVNADYLLGHLERCASDYYYSYDSSVSKYKLYYLNSRTNNWNSTTTNVGFIDDGYVYDSSTDKCTKTQNLGLSISQYNFLYSLVGLFFGFILFWLVPSSKK